MMKDSSILPLNETSSPRQTTSPPFQTISPLLSYSGNPEPPSYSSHSISSASFMMTFPTEHPTSLSDCIIYVTNAGWPLFLAMVVNTGVSFYYLLPINDTFYLDELVFKMTFSHLPLLTHLVLASIRTTFDSAWLTTREQNAILWIFLLLQWLMQSILWMTVAWNREYARKFLCP